MSLRRLLVVLGLVFLPSCLYQVREKTDQVVCDLAARPFDLQPPETTEPSSQPATAERPTEKPAAVGPTVDVRASALIEATEAAGSGDMRRAFDGQALALVQADPDKDQIIQAIRERLKKLEIPREVPGSETPLIRAGETAAERAKNVDKFYPPLPPLPEELRPVPGPGGHPYTLAELQALAAANSPQLRQAAADVEAARGSMIQAAAYPNPTVTVVNAQPSSDGSTPGNWGGGVDQVVKTFGKLKLARAAAEMDLHNAELALKRARSDLSTAVRNAYFGVLVAQEAVRVTRALARLTDEVYKAQAEYLRGGFPAYYEPATLRAQAWTVRLTLQQALATQTYAWKQLVAAVGLRQLPLSEVAGRLDRAIPNFDYDTVLAHVLANHTDVLTARNTVEKARYNLKLAQITPYPDVDFNVQVLHDFVSPPMQVVPTVTVSMPLPVWDQNKGNIMAAEAALVRASEEPHRVELALTNTLATAYQGYRNNLKAVEDYRLYILPDLVRTYRGVFERRRLDPSLGFIDLVTAQQALTTGVSTYLGLLGSLWTSVVSVADVLQTDDLFQLAHPHELAPLNLDALPPWACEHPCAPGAPAADCVPKPAPIPVAAPPVELVLPAPRRVEGSASGAANDSWPALAPRQSFRAYWHRPEPAPEPVAEPPPPPPVPHPLSSGQ